MSLVVAAAGALGAVCRYLIGGLMQSRVGWGFPVGTLVVTLAGSFAMGLIVASSSGRGWSVVAVGFLGGFTTFSTWMVETLRLGLPSPRAVLNVAATLAGGLATAGLAYLLVG